jgi:hypothetical protein
MLTGTWHSAKNVSDEKIERFSVVEVVDVETLDDSARTVLLIRPIDSDPPKSDQRELPPVLAFVGAMAVEAGRHCEVSTGGLSVAAVEDEDAPLNIVFAVSKKTVLQPFTVDASSGTDTLDVEDRICGVYRLRKRLKGELVDKLTTRVALVEKIESFRLLCRADENINEGSFGRFRIHTDVLANGETGEEAALQGKTSKSKLHLNAFVRWGGASQDDWGLVEVVDGRLGVIGGGSSCPTQQYQLTILGDPTDGGFDLTFRFENNQTETVAFDHDDDKDSVYDKIAALDQIKDADGNVPDSLAVRGGPFPDWPMVLRIPTDGVGGGLHSDSYIVPVNITLTGGVRTRIRVEPIGCQ